MDSVIRFLYKDLPKLKELKTEKYKWYKKLTMWKSNQLSKKNFDLCQKIGELIYLFH